MKCKIFGMFWRGDIHDPNRSNPASALVPFLGEIELRDDGAFTGTTNDHWGEAHIWGEISSAALEFQKRYTRVDHGPVATGLHYLLRGSAINGGHGGWWGAFTQNNEGEWSALPGQAVCTIHPDPNG